MLDCDGSQNRRNDVNVYLGSAYIMLGSVGTRGLLTTWVIRRAKSLFPTISLAMCGRLLAWDLFLEKSACILHVTSMLRPSNFGVCCKLRGRLSADMSWRTNIFIPSLLPHQSSNAFTVCRNFPLNMIILSLSLSPR